MTELNTAQQELDNTLSQNVSHLLTLWDIYYTMRHTSLYDRISHTGITADSNNLTDSE